MSQATINYILSGLALMVTIYLGWSQHRANEWTRQMVTEIHEMHIELHNFLKETVDDGDDGDDGDEFMEEELPKKEGKLIPFRKLVGEPIEDLQTV